MKTIKILIVMMLVAMPVFSQTGMPSITVTESEKEFTLPIKRAKVDVKIVGSLAITTYDIHFFNPNNRTLEGQLDFPLADGVVVSRFGMDVNEKLREGVIVEKDKGRVTYENIVNRGVDPGLLEVTRGNNFRSRVYPLLSEKEKHIVIAYEEELKVTPDGLKYSLPLDMPNKLDSFSFKATIYSDFAEPINNSTNGSKFRHKDDSYTLLSEYTDYKAKELYEFIIPYFGEQSVQLETYNNEDFFRISLNPDMMLQQKEKPQTISILWDISASRLNSDIKKDLELLEEYLEYNKCNVELVPFSLYADEPSYFPNVDFAELKANINGLRIDGATNYSSVDINKLGGDEIFIFSDGIDNIGEGGFGDTEKPMYIINSSSISDHDVCRKLAQKTGGKYINLIDENTESALNLLNYNFPYFMGIEGAASEVYPKNEVVKGNINISGKLQSSSQLKLKFGYGNKVAKTIPINITEANRTNSGILHKIWAKQKLADLNLNQTLNETEITELGKKYSLVTAFTSLIVLETAWDYYRYKIAPPQELRKEYDSLATAMEEYYAKWQSYFTADSLAHIEYLKNEISEQVKQMKIWYDLDFKEVQYLDSCYKILDQKVADIVKKLDLTNDDKAYYVIDLKTLLPNFDFSKHKYINYSVVQNPNARNSYYTSMPFTSVKINDSSFVLWDSYPRYEIYHYTNRDAHSFTLKDTDGANLENLSFLASPGYKYIDGLDSKYENRQDISFDKDSNLRVKISSTDLVDYYQKLYLIKNGAYFLSRKNLKLIEEWEKYTEKVRSLVDTHYKELTGTPSEELITFIDLDSLLPEYAEYNNMFFKYNDLSWDYKYINTKNDSTYRNNMYSEKYFYDLSQGELDSSKMLNDYRYYRRRPIKDYYWESHFRYAGGSNIIKKNLINLDGIYYVSSLPYQENKDKIRDKYKDQIFDIHGKIAIKIAEDSSSLDLSKIYFIKNSAIAIDNQNYMENLSKNFISRIDQELYSEVVNILWKDKPDMGLYIFAPIKDIKSNWYNENRKALKLGLLHIDRSSFDMGDITVYSKNHSLTSKFERDQSTSHYNRRSFLYIDEDELKQHNIQEIDSIEVKFSLKDSVISCKKETDGPLGLSDDGKYFKYVIPCKDLDNYFDQMLVFNIPNLSYDYIADGHNLKYSIENCSAIYELADSVFVGKVVDKEDKPIQYANVKIMNTGYSTYTSSSGLFTINYIPDGYFDLEVSNSPMENRIVKDINTKTTKFIKIAMKDKVKNVDEVDVLSRASAENSDLALYSDASFEAGSNENIVDAISMKAGVENSGSGFNIRGSRQSDDQFLVEGLYFGDKFTGGMGIGGSKYFPDTQEPSANAVVTTKEYQSSKEYYKTLNSVALGELEDTYFELRKDNAMNPSFFFDAAKVFEKQGQIKEACRVISNLAEINLEDHENLRRVGGFLMEHKEYALAKSIYKHILKIRSEEPQSFRDYALCLAENAEYQAAADSLYNLFIRNIDWSYKGIRTTLITEFNTLISKHKGEIDISHYNPEYIFEIPVDLRIEITWVMDETNLDLKVIEPDSTVSSSWQRFNINGGFQSYNMSRGYGPEVYMIRKAEPGTYKIRANYRSNRRQKSSLEPQVRCKIYTNYGKPSQQMQENIIKIEIDHGEVDLGEIEIE